LAAVEGRKWHRPFADAVARIHRAIAVGSLRREVGVPDLRRTHARGLRQLLTVIIGAGEPAKIAAIAGAGQEERCIGRLRGCGGCGKQRERDGRNADRDGLVIGSSTGFWL
jgi:hypothetical protein